MNTTAKYLALTLTLTSGLLLSNNQTAQAQHQNRDNRNNAVGRQNEARQTGRRDVVVRQPVRKEIVVRQPVRNTVVVRQPVRTTVIARPVARSRYSALPAYRSRVAFVPTGARVYPLGGVSYRYHNGLYYRPIGSSFEIVGAPIGFRLNVLPVGYSQVMVGPNPYYYYYGAFYQPLPYNAGYQVIAPPVGARIPELPNGYDQVYIDGTPYYVFDGIYYRAVTDEQGYTWFEVVGKR